MTEELIKCQYCGEEKPKRHERFCSKNPNNVRSKKNKPDADAPKQTDQAEPEQLIISDVRRHDSQDMVAWYENQEGKRVPLNIDYAGIVISKAGKIPHVLVLASDGALVPPACLSGFIGIFSRYHEWTEAAPKPMPEETQADQVMQIEKLKVPDPEPIKKTGLFASIFSKKEQKEAIPDDTKEMLKEIANGSV